MGAEDGTDYQIHIEADGGEEAASQLGAVADAEDQIAEGHSGLGDELGKGLETGGIHLLGHEILAANGAMGASRAMMPLLGVAARELNAAMGALGGPIMAIVAGAAILGPSLYHLIEAHVAHTKTVDDEKVAITNASKALSDYNDEVTIAEHPELKDLTEQLTKQTAEVEKQRASMASFVITFGNESVWAKEVLATEQKKLDVLVKQGDELKKKEDLILHPKSESKDEKSDLSEQMAYAKEAMDYNVKYASATDDEKLAHTKESEAVITGILGQEKDKRIINELQYRTEMLRIQGELKDATDKYSKDNSKTQIDYMGDAATYAKSSYQTITTALGQMAVGTQNIWQQTEVSIIDGLATMVEQWLTIQGGAMMAAQNYIAAAADFAAVGMVKAGTAALTSSLTGTSSPSSTTSSSISGSGGGGSVAAPTPGGSTVSTAPTTVNITINAGMMFTPDQATLTACMQNFWTQSIIMMKQGQVPQVEFA